MRQKLPVSETLSVDIVTVPSVGVVIGRKDGGLVRVELDELGPLVRALVDQGAQAVAIARGEPYEEDLPF